MHKVLVQIANQNLKEFKELSLISGDFMFHDNCKAQKMLGLIRFEGLLIEILLVQSICSHWMVQLELETWIYEKN